MWVVLKREISIIGPPASAERSYNIGSVHPSFCLPVSFLGIGSLVFSETWHGVSSLYIIECGRAGFLEKICIGRKWPKMIKKWPKSRVFGIFKKIMSLVLSAICVKRKILWFIDIVQKLHAWEKSGSQVIAQMAVCQLDFSIL